MKGLRVGVLLLFFGLLSPTEAKAQVQVCAEGTMCGREPPPKTSFPSDPKKEKFTPVDCQNLPNHHLSDDGTWCLPNKKQPCGIIQSIVFSDPNCVRVPIRTVLAVDPNDKAGPAGVTDSRFLNGGVPLQYTLLFENEASATAPAQRVVVTDQLDASTMDLETLSLGPISFGDTIVSLPPGLTHYTAGIDLRPSQNLIVRIDAGLDKTGVLTWSFTSIDPATLQLTTDPLAGFLPPNSVPPMGQGGVQFTVMPKSPLATGTAIRNQASVVFDVNAPINTPVWTNTIDNSPPITRVLPLAASQTSESFSVQWSGTDQGAGIWAVAVFVSDNGAPFTTWLEGTTATSATYSGQTGHTYGFFAIGTDLVGNVEPMKTAAEASTRITQQTACANDVGSQVQITRSGYGYNFTTGRFVQTVTLKNTSASAIAAPISLVLDNLSSNATLFNPSGTTQCAVPAGSPFVNLPGNLGPGASGSVTLQFTNPTKMGITYAARVLAGSAGR